MANLYSCILRLNTNTHNQEHGAPGIFSGLQRCAIKSLELLKSKINQDNFAEAVMNGGQGLQSGFRSKNPANFQVKPSTLTQELVQLAYKLFSKPKQIVKRISIGYDFEGHAYFDVHLEIPLSKYIHNVVVLRRKKRDRKSFIERMNGFNLLMNIMLNTKWSLVRNIILVCSVDLGVQIDTLQELVLEEHLIDYDRESFDYIESRQQKLPDSKYEWCLESSQIL